MDQDGDDFAHRRIRVGDDDESFRAVSPVVAVISLVPSKPMRSTIPLASAVCAFGPKRVNLTDELPALMTRIAILR